MKKLIFFAFFLFYQCSPSGTMDRSTWIEEIRQTETAFNDLAAKQGVKAAFLAFAAENAVMIRSNQVIKGKTAIADYFDRQPLQDVKLSWSPDFIDLSDDGTLGYSYGQYTFSARDSSGNSMESQGIFHTVWKRQADGSWKFVYD